MKNTNNWYDLKILAESDEIVSDDEVIYLDKEYKQKNKQDAISKKIEKLSSYNITVDDIVYQNLKLDYCYNYLENKLYDEFANGKDFHDFVVTGTKLIKPPSYAFKVDRYEKLSTDYLTLPYKYYMVYLLNNYSYKRMVDYFNSTTNISRELKNTNIFIDSLYELNNFIKFKFNKLVQHLKLHETEEMTQNAELQKFIGILSSYKSFDTANKILDDLGINEEDFEKILQLLNIIEPLKRAIFLYKNVSHQL